MIRKGELLEIKGDNATVYLPDLEIMIQDVKISKQLNNYLSMNDTVVVALLDKKTAIMIGVI